MGQNTHGLQGSESREVILQWVGLAMLSFISLSLSGSDSRIRGWICSDDIIVAQEGTRYHRV
jgi:hypothetical protein